MEKNPYAPPASSLAGAPEVIQEQTDSGFRDLSGITSTVSLLLLIGLGLHIVAIASALMQLDLLSHPPYTMAQAKANDLRQQVITNVQLILFFATVIVFGRWIYLAHQNLPNLGARYLRFTPVWAVGSFFIPFLNLWGPYQAMRDLAKASRAPRQWELEDSPPPIVIWWILWLVVQLIGSGAFGGKSHKQTLVDLQEMTIVGIAGGVLSLPLYLLARYIVRRVWRDQSENYSQMDKVTAV